MLNVALTGNVAAGKSSVLALFAAWGATVIDADALVREVQAPGSPVLTAIAAQFGKQMILPDGSLDRAGLRRRVAGDGDALGALNAIVHPAVRRRRAAVEAEAVRRGDCIVVNDIPLLFEVLDPDAFDVVVLVDAPEEARRRRLMRDRGLTDAEAERLMASQMPAAGKRERSRFIIDNDDTLDALERASWDVWCAVRRDAAERHWGGTGPLLAMFAHPDDESFAAGGTLARYADAGAEVHVWCATSGDAGTLHGGGLSREELRALRAEELGKAAAILGVREVHHGGFPDGALTPGDPAGHRAAADILRRLRPAVVITFGPDGVTGHADHRAVCRWTTTAVQDTSSPTRLYYVTYPGAVAAASEGRIAGRPDDEIAARLDVRPWRSVKVASIEAHASQRFPFALDTPPGSDMMEREWYATAGDSRGLVFDLYEGPEPA